MNFLLYCPQCGNSMSVARHHVRTCIGCPHCRYAFRPAATSPVEAMRATAPHGVDDPPPLYPAVPTQLSAEAKSRVAAGVLGIFLGSLGLHRFYLGYTGVGLIQLCLTLGGVLIPPVICCAPVVAIWGFLEGIACLAGWMKDAQGRPLGP